MNTTLMSDLIAQIDLCESQKPREFPWKRLMESVIHEMELLTSSTEESDNHLFQQLAKQNAVLMQLTMISIISTVSK
jgi:hypothetical protein